MDRSNGLVAVHARILAVRNLDADKAGEFLRPICAALGALGVSEANVLYSGSGDEGAVEEISFEPEGLEIPEELSRVLEAWVEAVLPGGWEINEGSQGQVLIDVANAKAEIEHGEYRIHHHTFEIG